ncbi:amino acid permease [Candidatus Margulisiibacteriota bacterium]
MKERVHFLQGLIKDIIGLKMLRTRLKKDLGLLEVFCISSGAMISSGLFILVALAFIKTGPSIILSYLIASILMIPTILAKAELVSALPKTGGIFVFTDRSMGPVVGTISGLAAWFSLSFKTAFALLGMGIFVSLISPGITMWHEKLFAVGFCLFFMLINIIGVKLSGRFQSLLVLILLAILVLYVTKGVFSVELSRFSPFAPMGLKAIFATAGMVFISFAGTTKVAAVAGEVKNPGRNLPLGIFLSWAIVSIVYIGVIYVTVGVQDAAVLSSTLTPLSMGGKAIMGQFGLVIMTIAAILAFVTTGNAGILAASRDPMAMGRSGLLPRFFEKVSKQGTPWVSIMITTAFMMAAILLLDLEGFVKTASTLKLILFTFANLALIFMRRRKHDHYKPTFKAPFYPWMQIAGIIGYGVLIIDMGKMPLTLAGTFVLLSLVWYFLYAHRKVKKEYHLLSVIKNAADIGPTSYLENEELREIFIEKDEQAEKRFAQKINDCVLIELEDHAPLNNIFRKVSAELSENSSATADHIYGELIQREAKGHIIGKPGYSIIFSPVQGKGVLKIAMIRSNKDIKYLDRFPPAKAFFIVIASSDIRSFYLRSLMWLVQIAEKRDFIEKWGAAENKEELLKTIIALWKGPKHKYE